MKHPNMSDTLIACCGSIGYMLPYMRGEYAPHYPVPATMKNADIACIYTALSACQMETPCMACIEKYMDCLAFEYPFLDD